MLYTHSTQGSYLNAIVSFASSSSGTIDAVFKSLKASLVSFQLRLYNASITLPARSRSSEARVVLQDRSSRSGCLGCVALPCVVQNQNH